MSSFNAKEVKDSCVKWIKEWFENNGENCNCICGISGGKDSSIVAALCVEALGKNRVIGVLMPRGEQRDICFADMTCDYLDIKRYEININNAVVEIEMSLSLAKIKMKKQANINLPARIRMATLYAVSQSLNGRVANTCNLSEDWVGYSTRYGDSVGDFSPLSKLTQSEVKEIGKALGLPDILINKTPSDGLCGKSDEENFGFSYEILDKYIRTGEIEDKNIKNTIDKLHEKNKFKLELMPHFEYSR